MAPSSNCLPYLAHTLQLTLHDAESAVVFMTSEVVYVYVCEFISICQLSRRDREGERKRERESEGEATRINHKLKCCAINSSCSIGKTAKPTTLEKERAKERQRQHMQDMSDMQTDIQTDRTWGS